jgi:hypothetical protein
MNAYAAAKGALIEEITARAEDRAHHGLAPHFLTTRIDGLVKSARELTSVRAGRPLEQLLRQRPGRLRQVKLVGVEEHFAQPDVERLL